MKTPSTFDTILTQQKEWAGDKKYDRDPNSKLYCYFDALRDNLFPNCLSTQTIDEYSSGRGKELEMHMRALYSSSALAVNLFEYWRQSKRISDIATACKAPVGMSSMAFESKHKIANLGTPHLDVEFNGGVKPFAIEAKFSEPFQHKVTQRNKTNLDKYLENKKIWQDLDNLREVAEEVFKEEGKKTSWRYLDVPQLIKHILGLSYKYKASGFTLCYLWYCCDTDESRTLAGEIKNFSTRLGHQIDLVSLTYQDLYKGLCSLADVDQTYLDYLGNRYFKKDLDR